MNDILNNIFWSNPLRDWLIAAGTILVSLLITRLISSLLIRRISSRSLKNNTRWSSLLEKSIQKCIIPLLFLSSTYYALNRLKLPAKADRVLGVAFLAALTYFALRIISAAFKKFIYGFLRKQENSAGKEQQASGLILIVNGIIWTLGIVFLIDNLGYNVSTLVAGLGIGGIAIALAAQTILGDLFSYFVIFFDRPFEIGDFIIVDDKSGVIEHIGIKTTRIRTLGGEQLICSNTDLTNARVHNYKRLQKRRIVFQLRVTQQTPHEQLAAIPGIVRDIIASKEQLAFDRGHFSGYGDYSLNFEFVYHVLHTDYAVFMENQQAVYLDIFSAFQSKGIRFAHPVQTLFVQPGAAPVQQQ